MQVSELAVSCCEGAEGPFLEAADAFHTGLPGDAQAFR